MNKVSVSSEILSKSTSGLPVEELEKCKEGFRFHVYQWNFLFLRSQSGVEHGIEDGAATGEDELMGGYPLLQFASPNLQVDPVMNPKSTVGEKL